MANGMSPKTVVIAVNNTGRNLALPACMIHSSRSSFSRYLLVSKSQGVFLSIDKQLGII